MIKTYGSALIGRVHASLGAVVGSCGSSALQPVLWDQDMGLRSSLLQELLCGGVAPTADPISS